MQRPSDYTPNLFDDADIPTPLNVVIAYDDVPAGQRAMRILAHLTRGFAREIELHPQAWRFDLLDDRDWRALAVADMLKADMLIISTSAEGQYTAAIEAWIRACLAQKRGAALAVILLANTRYCQDDSAPLPFQFVKRAADEAGHDFFFTSARTERSSSVPQSRRYAPPDGGGNGEFDGVLHLAAPRWNADP